MSIQNADFLDLEALYSITKSCGEFLESKGIFQWNSQYPSKKVLLNDIQLNQIWKLVDNNYIIGLIVLTDKVDKEYEPVHWISENSKNLYIHRLAIHPNFQGKGFARKLMDFAENFAIENNFKSIRLDTFSKNERNQRFYEMRGYVKLESIYFPNQSTFPFYCFEKLINV